MFRSREGREQLGPAKRVESSKPRGMLSRRRAITILGAVIGLPLLPSADQSKTATRLHLCRGHAPPSPPHLPPPPPPHHRRGPSQGVSDMPWGSSIGKVSTSLAGASRWLSRGWV